MSHPSITSPMTATFAENGTGTVYTITASSSQPGVTYTYSLMGVDAALFSVSATGAVSFVTSPDF